MLTIVDYGMGNLGSLANMIKKVGGQCRISEDLEDVRSAEKLILPGVGSFDAAMQRIHERGLTDVLNQKALTERVPTLGVCLGMQLLTSGSEEGKLPGLNWISGRATRFRPSSKRFKVPHMGWNEVRKVGECPLTDPLGHDARFYFVHSYFVHVDDEQNSVLKTTHEIEFDSFIRRDNIYGAQFHPEKSHAFGMTLLRAFLELSWFEHA